MGNMLTVRLTPKERGLLDRRARQASKTVSEFVREILWESLEEKPLSAKIGHLKGRLDLRGSSADAWRRQIRQRNWRR